MTTTIVRPSRTAAALALTLALLLGNAPPADAHTSWWSATTTGNYWAESTSFVPPSGYQTVTLDAYNISPCTSATIVEIKLQNRRRGGWYGTYADTLDYNCANGASMSVIVPDGRYRWRIRRADWNGGVTTRFDIRTETHR